MLGDSATGASFDESSLDYTTVDEEMELLSFYSQKIFELNQLFKHPVECAVRFSIVVILLPHTIR